MTRVLLADDHALVRQGIRRIVESREDMLVVGEAASGSEAVAMARSLLPDIAMLDVGMKELNGLEALFQIRRFCPNVKVVMLSMHADERYVIRSVREGASGYVLKDCAEQDLISAMDAVRRGNRYFSPQVHHMVDAPGRTDDRFERLTERERHIYQMLAEGNSNKDIAAKLGLSPHTVETHRARIMEKLELHSAAELVLSAVRRGLVQ